MGEGVFTIPISPSAIPRCIVFTVEVTGIELNGARDVRAMATVEDIAGAHPPSLFYTIVTWSSGSKETIAVTWLRVEIRLEIRGKKQCVRVGWCLEPMVVITHEVADIDTRGDIVDNPVAVVGVAHQAA